MTIFPFTNLFVGAPTVNHGWASRRRVCVTVAKSKCKCSSSTSTSTSIPQHRTHTRGAMKANYVPPEQGQVRGLELKTILREG